MPQTHDIGRVFMHAMNLPVARTWKVRLIEKADTQEISYPYRAGTSVLLRMPWVLRGLVIGIWGDPHDDEDEAMYRALGGVMRDRHEVHKRVNSEGHGYEDDALVT